MTVWVLKPNLLVAVGLLVAGVGRASPPSPATSTKPTFIIATGHANPADPAGAVTYIIRDLNNVPEPHAEIVLDFTSCTDIWLSQSIAGTTTTTDCGLRRVTAITDGLGQVVINVVAGGNGTSPPRGIFACVAVTVNGLPFPSIPAATFDRDGVNGVGAGDLALVVWDFIHYPTAGRSDFDNSASVGAADLGILIKVFTEGASALSGAPYCP